MKYISTRNSSKTFEFKDVFIKGLADDGGLFIPKSFNKFSKSDIDEFKDLNYQELAKKIIYPFIGNFMNENDLSKIIDKSYSVFRKKNVVDLVKVGDRSVLELFHGPTLAFKDVAMQLLGNFYEYYLNNENEKLNIVVATSGDTGAAAIDAIFHKGKLGESYNVGGLNEWTNLDLVHRLCDLMDVKLDRTEGSSRGLIRFVKDRAGHDMRYAIDASKLEEEIGWKPSITFEEGLSKTIDWYLNNPDWIAHVTSGAYLDYYKKMYT